MSATVTLAISGMTCGGCVRHVKQALAESPGAESVEVDLKSGRAVVRGTALAAPALIAAVVDAGYQASVAGE